MQLGSLHLFNLFCTNNYNVLRCVGRSPQEVEYPSTDAKRSNFVALSPVEYKISIILDSLLCWCDDHLLPIPSREHYPLGEMTKRKI